MHGLVRTPKKLRGKNRIILDSSVGSAWVGIHTEKIGEKKTEYSSIAQSVERSAVNRVVVGSSPTRGVEESL